MDAKERMNIKMAQKKELLTRGVFMEKANLIRALKEEEGGRHSSGMK